MVISYYDTELYLRTKSEVASISHYYNFQRHSNFDFLKQKTKYQNFFSNEIGKEIL